MANRPLERIVGRRTSILAAATAVLLIVGALPAIDAQLDLGDEAAAAATTSTTTSTTTTNPAEVGVRRLDALLEDDLPSLGAVGFATGTVVVVLASDAMYVVDVDDDVVGVIEPRPVGQLLEPLRVADDIAVARTGDGDVGIDSGGRIVEVPLQPGSPDLPEISTSSGPGCEPACHVVEVEAPWGVWLAEFSGELDSSAPAPRISPDATAVFAWIWTEGGSRLEVATQTDTRPVPFSHEGSGDAVMTAWAAVGDGILYARAGETRVHVFSVSRWATGTIWVDAPIEAAAALPAGP